MPAAWVSAAAAVYGATQSGGGGGGGGGGGSSSGGPPAYVPTNQAGMDQNFQNNYNEYQNQLTGFNAQVNPLAYQALINQYNNPYGANFLNYANVAGNNNVTQGYLASNAANSEYKAGDQIYQNAFDPQSALYNQNKQQLVDSTRAAQYARGIQTSPYGAAIEGNVLGNFQNDWQNQQLQRQSLGINSMGSANQTANTLGTNAGTLFELGGQAPYAALTSMYGNQTKAISDYYGAVSPYLSGLQQLQSNSLSYNNYGQGAQSTAFNQGQANLQNQLNGIQGWASAANDISQGWKNWNAPTPTPTNSGNSYSYSSGDGGGDGGAYSEYGGF